MRAVHSKKERLTTQKEVKKFKAKTLTKKSMGCKIEHAVKEATSP